MNKIELIKAGAGSGKTYTLTTRLAAILGNKDMDIQPSQVIVTTYTNTAAAEIKERSRQELIKIGRFTQAAQLDSAAIGTVHSVAQRFLSRYWHLLGTMPNPEVMTEQDKILYRNQSLSELVRDPKNKKAYDLIWKFFYTFKPQKNADAGFYHTLDYNFWMTHLEDLIDKISYYAVTDDKISESIHESISEIRDIYGKNAGTKEVKLMEEYVQTMFGLAKQWLTQYADFKHAHGVIDFDDMEKGFLQLLDEQEVQEDISSNYKLLMVDEFQDSNPIQLKIFLRIADLIAKDSPLRQSTMLVGDPKQSIFAFRGSCPELVNRLAELFPKEDPDDEEGTEDPVTLLKSFSLKKNYRSMPALVDLANHLFGPEPTGKGIFPDMTCLEADRPFVPEMKANIQKWEFIGAGAADKQIPNLARRIREMVETGDYKICPKGSSTLRRLKYEDIAILCRVNNTISSVVNALSKEGVPVSSYETSIYDMAEIQLLFALLYLATPKPLGAYERAHEWATVLHLWLDWETPDILLSRLNAASDSDNFNNWMESNPELVPVRLAIDHAKGLPMDQQIQVFVNELRLRDMVGKWGRTEIRCQTMASLQAKATEYLTRCRRLEIKATVGGLVAEVQSSPAPIGADYSQPTVKVLTYHKSKGLEWPMVILMELGKDIFYDFENRNYWGVREHSQEVSRGEVIPPYVIHLIPSPSTNREEPLHDKGLVTESEDYNRTRASLIEENKRLLYVGVTRARDYLILPIGGRMNKNSWLQNAGLSYEDFNGETLQFDNILLKEPAGPKDPGEDATPTKKKKYKEAMEKYTEEMAVYHARKAHEDEIQAARLAEFEALRYSGIDLPNLEELDLSPLYLQPSKLGKPSNFSFGAISVGKDITETVAANNLHSTVGTCIHNIYAACPSHDGSMTQEECHMYQETARKIAGNYRLTNILKDTDAIVENLHALYQWLELQYGKAISIVHEYPFNIRLAESGQIVKGEIDLIWQTENGDVIIDYKTLVDPIERIVTPSSDRAYLGHHYVAQLNAYKEIAEKSGRKVLDTILYYNLRGIVVKL